MSSPTCESLRAVNCALHARLTRLLGEPHGPAAMVPTEFTDLLHELRRASACLRSLPAAAAQDAEMVNEISGYRSKVEQFGKLLPSIRGRLLIEKARLETARAHAAKAAAWAQGSKKTL